MQGDRIRGADGRPPDLRIPWRKPSMRRRESLAPARRRLEPIARSGPRPAPPGAAIARGRRWLDELITDPNASSHRRAGGLQSRHVEMTISLAFLAPDLVQAAIDGRLPRGLGVARLRELPASEWPRQRSVLGLSAP